MMYRCVYVRYGAASRKPRVHPKKKDVKNGNGNAYSFYLMLQAEESPSKERYDECIRALARAGCVNFEAYMCERAGE